LPVLPDAALGAVLGAAAYVVSAASLDAVVVAAVVFGATTAGCAAVTGGTYGGCGEAGAGLLLHADNKTAKINIETTNAFLINSPLINIT
jgi:hypothetical protein